jgi:bacillithiol biosynthesis deacetylase BshB1
MKLDLLVIAAHPDDAELTSGGTLLKMAARGYATGVLDLTAGEMGTRGTTDTRAREAARASKILRLKWRGNLGLPDSDVQPTRENKLRAAHMIRELRPRTVILPYWKGRHPDHYHAGELGYEACFLAGLVQLPIEGEAFRPFKILYATAYAAQVRPSFIVDITREYEKRRQAILAYESQFRAPKNARKSRVHIPLDQLEDRMNVLARYYGRMVGVRYGEGFVTREVMQVEDVVKLPVRSI